MEEDNGSCGCLAGLVGLRLVLLGKLILLCSMYSILPMHLRVTDESKQSIRKFPGINDLVIKDSPIYLKRTLHFPETLSIVIVDMFLFGLHFITHARKSNCSTPVGYLLQAEERMKDYS